MVFLRAVLSILFLSCSYIASAAVLDQTQAVDAAYKLVADMFPETKQTASAEEQVTLLAKLANDKSVFSLFQEVSYANDEACDFTIGPCTMKLTWGFTGSGDVLSSLPAMTLQVKGNASAGPATAEGFALLLAQKGVVAKGMQHEAVANAMAMLSKNPLCLVALKVALLFKDHSHDKAFVRSEMANLLMRLSLTKLPAAVSNIEKISALLPEVLHTRLNTFAPELLDFMDVCWAAMTHNNDNPIADLYSVEILEVKNSKAAEAMQKVIGSYVGRSLLADMKADLASKGFLLLDASTFKSAKKDDMRVFTIDTCSSTALSRLPVEVRTALDAAKMHTVTTAVMPSAHYFVFKTLTLSATDTAQAFAVVLMNGARRMVQDRQAYFASHPLAVAEHKQAEAAARSQRAQVAAFLATEQGKRFGSNLESKVEWLVNDLSSAPEGPCRLDGSNPALLAQFRKQAEAFRAAGEEVPAWLVEEINDLIVAQVPGVGAELNVVAGAKRLAWLYELHTKTLLNDLDNDLRNYFDKNCAHTTDKYVQARMYGEFQINQIPACVYAKWLKQETVRINIIAGQLNKLINYRHQHKAGLLNSTQEPELAEMAQLEMQVGHLLACQTPATFVETLRRAPTHFDFVKQELFSNHVAYKALQDDVLNQLTLIMQRSPHLQENLDVYRYAIELFMPTLLPMFDRLVAAQQAVL